MRSRQAGITFIGWVLLLVPVAIVGYAIIRLTPLYLNYMKVAKAMEQAASEYKGETTLNPAMVQMAISRRFDVDGVNYPLATDISVRRDGEKWVIEADYEDPVPLFGGISLLVRFDKRAVVE